MNKKQRKEYAQLVKDIRRARATEAAYQQRRALDNLADAINALSRTARPGICDPDPERNRRLWEVQMLRTIADYREKTIPRGPKR